MKQRVWSDKITGKCVSGVYGFYSVSLQLHPSQAGKATRPWPQTCYKGGGTSRIQVMCLVLSVRLDAAGAYPRFHFP